MSPHNFLPHFIIVLLSLSSLTNLARAEKLNSTADIKVAEKTEQGVTFTIKQIPTDQVNAFYIGRGFTKDQIKPYADTCVYTSILRNDTASGRIHYIRTHWDVVNEGKPQKLRKTSDWLKQLKQEDIKPSSLIAFRFAQLPEEQEYEPGGDWNQGMLSVDLPAGSQFDMIIRWDIEGKPYELTLPSISCMEKTSDS